MNICIFTTFLHRKKLRIQQVTIHKNEPVTYVVVCGPWDSNDVVVVMLVPVSPEHTDFQTVYNEQSLPQTEELHGNIQLKQQRHAKHCERWCLE